LEALSARVAEVKATLKKVSAVMKQLGKLM
jgi:hypothetical protein